MPFNRGINTLKLFLFYLVAHNAFSATKVNTPHLTASLLSSHQTLEAGESFHVGLFFEIEPEWHIYWKNPGDSGEAPRYKWKHPQNIVLSDIKWPSPKRIPLSILANYGYEKKILLPVEVKVPKSFKDSSLKLQLDAEWLVCKEECIPEKASFEISLPLGKASLNSPHSELFKNTLNSIPSVSKIFRSHHFSLDSNLLRLSIFKSSDTQNTFANADWEIFPINDGVFEAGTPPVFSEDENSLNLDFVLTPQTLTVPQELDFHLKTDTPIEFTSQLKMDSTQNTSSKFWWALLAAFFGGLLLNLMPCVLPVLSLKAFAILKNKNQTHKLKSEGLAFGFGVLISFWLLAGLLILLRSGGEALGWGFQLQNPLFVILMAWLFVILSLNFFGVFEMGQSIQSWVGRKGISQESGWSHSFGSGVLATLIATPCTAPFMGTAIGFALTLPAYQSLVIFTLLGLGMAFPILLLSFFPTSLKFLPSPGAWMVSFKQFLGFPMLATAVWLLWVYGQQTDLDSVARFLFSSLSIAVIFWIVGRFARSWKRLLVIIFMLILSVWLALPLLRSSPSVSIKSSSKHGDYSGLNYESYTPQKLNELLENQKAVYVDFTAAWCLICQVNKRVVFGDSAVQEIFKEKDIVILKADWTDKNETILKELEKYGRSGVPLNLYFSPKSPKAPVVFPTLLRPQTVIDAVLHKTH